MAGAVTPFGWIEETDSGTAGVTPSGWLEEAAGTSTFTYTGTGGATTGGTADLAKWKAYTATGGAIAAGAAIVAASFIYPYTGSGGATAGGAATTAPAYILSYTGSGGAVTGGTATTAYVAGDASVTYTYTGSGGATAGGAATLAKIKDYLATGGATAGGSATTAPAYIYTYTGTGGATAAGAATTAFVAGGQYAYVGSGGAETGGAAVTDGPKVSAEQPSGGWSSGFSIEFAREQRRLKREAEERERERLEIEAEEKAALAREIAALETHLVDEGALEKVSRETELLRLRDLAASFDALPNRAQRALDYAERAKTEAALILAQREMQRLAEEEEMAVVLMLAMMD